MVPFLNILLIVTLLVIGIAIWQAWQIIKTNKDRETVDEKEARKLERRLNVIHVAVYILVVILVFRLYLMFVSGGCK